MPLLHAILILEAKIVFVDDSEAEEGSAEEAGEAGEGSAKQAGEGLARDGWASLPEKKGEGDKPEVQSTLVPPTSNAPPLLVPGPGVNPYMSPNLSPYGFLLDVEDGDEGDDESGGDFAVDNQDEGVGSAPAQLTPTLPTPAQQIPA
ncbi:uncharacterized protein A4U43_C10F11880 [Asparagus officinalis]|uniref:Uncharacterized protein n=1 Tax=Asparagus officinalis TaxID=4686 RepID=A0A5P1E5H7_ASPOF|nr:uncharacterized protein A4U43_C10F11880 [Asparagus officinalis]